MSAFVVPIEHIRVLVDAGIDYDRPATTAESDGSRFSCFTGGTVHQVGQLLLSANIRSVNFFYKKEVEEVLYVHVPALHGNWTPTEILKAISSLRCQSNESPGWEASEAAAYLTALEQRVICELPGWDTAAWVITTETLPETVRADA